VIFVANDRPGDLFGARGGWRSTLAIEVLSAVYDTHRPQPKLQLYARYAVPYFWIVDPDGV